MKRRRRARELALQGLYSYELSGNSIDETVEEVRRKGGEDEEIFTFATELFKKTAEQSETLDSYVVSVTENWELKRIALMDRLVLRMALCELLYFEEIPPKVTINEAIDLAKTYSTEQSGRFVNGILDSLYQSFKKENKMHKRGRGLVDQKIGNESKKDATT